MDKMTIQKIKVVIQSRKPITLENVDEEEFISYIKIASVKMYAYYYTELLIAVCLEKAKAWYDEETKIKEKLGYDHVEWNGNVFESGYWDSLESALVEEGICPDGYDDDIEIEYL
jgi:hypothetical protein